MSASSSVPGKVVLSFQDAFYPLSFTYNQSETKSRSSVKDWKTRLRNGQDASTPYSRSSDLMTARSSGTFRVTRRFNVGPQWGQTRTATSSGFPELASVILDPTTYLVVPTKNENLAKTRFAAKVREFEGKWQAGAFAGEIGKTVRALRNPLKSLREGIHGYLGNVKKLAQRPLTYTRYSRAYGDVLRNRQREALSRALTGTYLEWKFGMTPLLYDMVDAQKAFHHIVERPHVDLDRISASSEWSYKLPPTEYAGGSAVQMYGPHPWGGYGVYGDIRTTRTLHVSGRVAYSGALSADLSVPGVLPTLKLLPRDFVPTIWQLLPWSWAIDYFANVGDMLDVLSTSFGALVWCNRAVMLTVDQSLTTQLVCADTPSLWTLLGSSGSGNVLWTSRRYSRAPFVPSIMNMTPSLMFRSPSLNQGLNLGAALHQARGITGLLAQRYA